MWQFIFSLTIKDWFIVVTSFILITCILEIRKLKKSLALEIHRRLLPQLNLEIDPEALALYLKNESFFLAQDIEIEDTKIIISDYGFNVGVTLKFPKIEILRPQERVKLELKAYDEKKYFLDQLSEKLIPHLLNVSFKLKVYLYNIENIKFCITVNKKQKKFYIEKIDFCQQT